ncbi:hypothetical protein ACQZ6F_17420 [Rhizobium sp. A22-96]
MSEQEKNVENLLMIRDALVKRRREKAFHAAQNDGLGTIKAVIEIQQQIEIIDRAVEDEVKQFNPEVWKMIFG